MKKQKPVQRKSKAAELKKLMPEPEELENIAESLFNCSISTTSRAINIHVSAYQRSSETMAKEVIDVAIYGFKYATRQAAIAKRDVEKQIEEDATRGVPTYEEDTHTEQKKEDEEAPSGVE